MTKDGYVQEPVAVVGIACRLPGGSNSPQKLWELLERGGVASNKVPESRFNIKAHHDGSMKPRTMRPLGGMFLEDIDPADFDASFFEISRTEAISMDPNQRQMLEVAYEGLENAGISLEQLDGASVGCFVGSYASGKRSKVTTNAHQAKPKRNQTMPICKAGIQKTALPTSPLEQVVQSYPTG